MSFHTDLVLDTPTNSERNASLLLKSQAARRSEADEYNTSKDRHLLSIMYAGNMNFGRPRGGMITRHVCRYEQHVADFSIERIGYKTICESTKDEISATKSIKCSTSARSSIGIPLTAQLGGDLFPEGRCDPAQLVASHSSRSTLTLTTLTHRFRNPMSGQ